MKFTNSAALIESWLFEKKNLLVLDFEWIIVYGNCIVTYFEGNIAYLRGDYDKAYTSYREALSNDAGCVQVSIIVDSTEIIDSGKIQNTNSWFQALYNLGLVCRQQGNVEQALECFYKLHNILLNNVQVLCQLAAM